MLRAGTPRPFAGVYEGRRVFITGHTGFKGGWLALWLSRLGARVAGYALAPPTTPSLFEAVALGELVTHTLGDVRDRSGLRAAMLRHEPEIVFHLAAQPLVRRSYEEPVETYETNVLGTVNLLEAARACPSLRAVVVVTSDKCYEDRESGRAYREDDALGGGDPYSSSKGCAELVTAAYRRSFFAAESAARVASVRAGNVIGGGDWADDRIVPDCVRALSSGQTVAVRNPEAVRPWQSVLDPLAGYLWLGRWLLTGSHGYERSLELRPQQWRGPDCAGGGRGRRAGVGRRGLAGDGRRRRRAARSRSTEARRRQGGGAARLARGLRCAARHRGGRALVQGVLRGRGAGGMLPRCHDDIDEYVAAARDLGLAWAVAGDAERRCGRRRAGGRRRERPAGPGRACATRSWLRSGATVTQACAPPPFEPGVSRVPYAGRVFDAEEMVNLVDSALEFWLSHGRYSQRFEAELAGFLGLKHCLFVNSGSSANLLAFMALTSDRLGERRVRRGDEVITVACGFPTTVAPMVQFGAVPVFVDVEPATANVAVGRLEAALSPRTRAVFLAHTLGNPFDVAAVLGFCRRHDLWLIEDNCDSLGARYDGRLTGGFGHMGTSSFYPPHQMTTGEGGAVYTDDDELHAILLSLRDWGRDCVCPSGVDDSCGRRFAGDFGTLPHGYDHKYVYSHFGFNLQGHRLAGGHRLRATRQAAGVRGGAAAQLRHPFAFACAARRASRAAASHGAQRAELVRLPADAARRRRRGGRPGELRRAT